MEDPSLIRLFERLMNSGTPLGEYVGDRINRGITHGPERSVCNKSTEADDLIAEDPNSEQIIKPWLRGKDIKRWRPEWAGLYIIFTRRGIDIEQYPAIKEHLSWWYTELEPKKTRTQLGPGRKPGEYSWYEIQDSTAYFREFDRPKIVWKKTSFSPAFLFDSSGFYLSNTLHCISGVDSWLAGVMNSSIMEFLMVLSINLLRGEYIELTSTRIEPLPVPDLQEDTKAELQELVVNIGNGTQSQDQINAIEKQIDSILFHAYRVPVLQRKLVLDWLCERREALGMEVEPEWRRLNSLRATSGAWKGSTDGEQLKRDIRASRQLNTRSVPRL